MIPIRAIGIDLAFANTGLSLVELHPGPGGQLELRLQDLRLITTTISKESRKAVRKSSDELRRAREIHAGIAQWIDETSPSICFAEIPSGTQSASAARGLGIAVGVLASFTIPLVEVNPMEVKNAVKSGKGNPTKAEIIAWATKLWPDAPWRRHGGRITLDNEHLADAVAVVAAGVKSQPFQQLLALNPHAFSSPDYHRHPPSGVSRRRVSLVSVPVDK